MDAAIPINASQWALCLIQVTGLMLTGLIIGRIVLRECRPPSALGVSVSSSLIRRITMLRENRFRRLPSSRFVNRCITLSAAVVCTWIGCWSLAGQTATQEQGADSKVVAASHTTPLTSRARPTTAPWETIGDQSGYLSIQLDQILRHPDLQPYRPAVAASLDATLAAQPGTRPTVKQFGLDLDNVVQFNAGMKYSFDDDSPKPQGQRPSVSLGISTAELRTANPVDWPSLIRALDFKELGLDGGSSLDLENVRKEWSATAEKSRAYQLNLDSILSKTTSKIATTTATKRALWDVVSGGAVTMVCDVVQPSETQETLDGSDRRTQANYEMAKASEVVALGLDFSPDFKSCDVRIAIVPRENVLMKDLLEKFESMRDAESKNYASAGDDAAKHASDQLKQLKASIVESKTINGKQTKGYLMIRGMCSGSIEKLLVHTSIGN